MRNPNKTDQEFFDEAGSIGGLAIYFGPADGMARCTVIENKIGHLTISFSDGTDFYLQTDYDIATFAFNCGLLKAPDNWTGTPSELPDKWWEIDLESIAQCPVYYKAFAE